MRTAVVAVTAVVQFLLHYLAWAGVILGAVALAAGNTSRATELALGGMSLFVLKFVIGFIVVTSLGLVQDRREGGRQS